MRRNKVLLALPLCAAFSWAAPAALASRTEVIPAPPGQASAVAAQVGSLLDISKTDAAADAGTASSSASVVRLGGEPLLSLGGSQNGDGQTGGALLDTGATLPAQVQVAPWSASAQGTGTATRQSESSAAVATANVPDIASAGVLTSQSEASHTDQKSTGKATSDGLQLGVLDALRLVLLHSEGSTEGNGHSYLVGLNGTEIGTDEQLGESPLCGLELGLASLTCLSVSGGNGGTNVAAQIAEVVAAVEPLGVVNPVSAFTAAASSGTGQPAAVAAPAETAVAGAESSRGATPDTAATTDTVAAAQNENTGALPRTGAAVASIAGLAFALMLLGLALRRFRGAPTAS